ncbi:MAG: MBL fold metallo-hydrolase [Myxococcota bacterium]
MWWLVACSPRVVEAEPPVGPGELVIEQLDLGRSRIGESALVMSAGTTVLVDVGNDVHAGAIREALARYGRTHVDFVVLTHFHADHIGGFDALVDAGDLTVGEVIWRGAVHLDDANTGELDEVRARLGRNTALCTESGCDLPYTVPVGPASLTIFLADAVVATPGGTVDLGRDLSDENARSLGGIVTWDAFDWLFAGDLTGGGKGTPDLEGLVVGAGPALPPVDVLQVNHHGISSSTSAAWVDALLVDGDAHAVVGANDSYLDAPSEEALAALGPRLGGGHVWVTEDGVLGNHDAHTVVAHGPVTVRVRDGVEYEIRGGTTSGTWFAQ